jgi:hypothetical protein
MNYEIGLLSDRGIERFAYCLLPSAYCLLFRGGRGGRRGAGAGAIAGFRWQISDGRFQMAEAGWRGRGRGGDSRFQMAEAGWRGRAAIADDRFQMADGRGGGAGARR